MIHWHTIAQVIQRIAADTGRPVTEDDIIRMAERDQIKVGARLPIRKGPGNKEVQWYHSDGKPVGITSVFTDGVLRRLDQYRLQQLLLHDGVDLAGARWEIPGGDVLIAGPDAGYITKADICVAEPEYRHILAALGAHAMDGGVLETPEERDQADAWKGLWWASIATIEMANNIAAKLADQGKPFSAREVSREMEKRVNDIERRAGTSRKCVGWDRIRRTVLRGWEFQIQ